MEIIMHNFGFGDCFRLQQEGKNALYVDFGIHMGSFTPAIRTQKYLDVIANMPQERDFLLTHYHDDHYAGAIEMIAQGQSFHDVYIPDIWSIGGNVPAVALTLLRGLITKSVLRDGLSLIDFLRSICHSTGCVHFVRRGSRIQRSYRALWPEPGWISPKSERLYQRLGLDPEQMAELNAIANQLIQIVLAFREAFTQDAKMAIHERLVQLDVRYRQLEDEFEAYRNLQYKLSRYGNGVSIVFQNDVVQDENILFTGDADHNALQWVSENRDGTIALHNTYRVIKVPHHGTRPYYFSFQNKLDRDSVLLIPNGENRFDWSIDSRYRDTANACQCRVLCANNLACHATNPACTCNRCDLVSPNDSKRVL